MLRYLLSLGDCKFDSGFRSERATAGQNFCYLLCYGYIVSMYPLIVTYENRPYHHPAWEQERGASSSLEPYSPFRDGRCTFCNHFTNR